MDDAIVSFDISWPVGALGGTFGFKSNNGEVEPVLAELSVGGEGASVEGFLVGGEAVQALLSFDDVVLEDIGINGGANLVLVLLEGRVRRGKDGEFARAEVNAVGFDGSGELGEVIASLDIGLVESLFNTFGTPEDFGSFHGLDGVSDAGTEGSVLAGGCTGGRRQRRWRGGWRQGKVSFCLGISIE